MSEAAARSPAISHPPSEKQKEKWRATYLPFASYWPKFRHVTSPSHKGDWTVSQLRIWTNVRVTSTEWPTLSSTDKGENC